MKKGEILAFLLYNVMVFTWCDIKCVRFIQTIQEIDTLTKNGQIKIKKLSAILEYNKMKSEVDKPNQLKVRYHFSHIMIWNGGKEYSYLFLMLHSSMH